MKSSDVIVIGAGIIGISLAHELRKRGVGVLIVERGEPGREASYAAAGMLASAEDIHPELRALAGESARRYPEFVHELEDESGLKLDLRGHGTILISCDQEFPQNAEPLSPQRLRSLEPAIDWDLSRNSASSEKSDPQICAAYLPERSVDPRALIAAAYKAARHREVDISSGAEVKSLLVEGGKVVGVQTERSKYNSPIVINCAGAWAGGIAPQVPVKPIKGQILAVIEAPALRHVVRSEKVYLVPRSDGRLLIGSTLEDVGYDKQTDVSTLERLFDAAVELVPGITTARRHEAWAGLRPATPDELPVLGETSVSGYFVAAGHYRDGILLAPITASLMADLVLGKPPQFDLGPFSPSRFPG